MTTKITKLEAANIACDAADAAWERAVATTSKVRRACRILAEGGTLTESGEDALYDVCRTRLSFMRTYDLSIAEAAEMATRVAREDQAAAWTAWQDAITAVEAAEKAAAANERRRARKAA